MEEKQKICQTILYLCDLYEEHKDIDQLYDDIYGYLQCLKGLNRIPKNIDIDENIQLFSYLGKPFIIFGKDLRSYIEENNQLQEI